jgi:hypothetical protein
MLSDELAYFFDECSDLKDKVDIFNAQLPKEWIDEALNVIGSVTVRRRKMPAEDIIRLSIGMSLMRHEPIQEIAARLSFQSKQLDNQLLARSSISSARQRVGSAPVEWLFNRSADKWSSQSHCDDKWHGLNLFSIDGTTFRTEDSEENRENFGSAHSKGELVSSFPAFRLACLMNVRSHIISRVSIGPFKTGELTVASQLLDNVPPKSVLLLDRLYHSAELLHYFENLGEERYWVTRLKSTIKYRQLEKYGDNDFLVERDLSAHARKKSPSLPRKWQMRVVKYQLEGYEPQEIATSLPIEKYSAAQIIELYHERWEIELGYREIKKTLLKNAITLRSKKPDLVIQELYGMLIAYNLIRHEAALAADVVELRPTRISFKTAMRVVLYDYYGMATASNLQSIPARLKELTDTIKDFILPKQKRPNYPRAVKMRMGKFPVKRSQKRKEIA